MTVMWRPRAALVSFRFGGLDGVAVEAVKWEQALQQLGWRTYRVAGALSDGARGDDVLIPALAIGADVNALLVEEALDAALAPAQLVVVENLLSLPLNTAAAVALVRVLRRRGLPTVLHHHDLPWQRPQLPQPESFPPPPSVLPNAVHVTINDYSRRELEARGIPATTIRNRFDELRPRRSRAEVRAELQVGDDDLLLVQPTRAIPRKNVPGGLRFAEQLQQLLPSRRVIYWLTGPAEEGYAPTLQRLLREASVTVRHQSMPDRADCYVACDLVLFPSLNEGFGNPVIESVWTGRPIVTGRYAALQELQQLGLQTLPLDDPQRAADVLLHGDGGMLDANLAVVRRHLSLARLPDDLRALFADAGWTRLARVRAVTDPRPAAFRAGTPVLQTASRSRDETTVR